MKKPYQIRAGRAVQRVRQWAEEENPAVQFMLPMIEILALSKQGAGELAREAGLRVILLAIQRLPGNPQAGYRPRRLRNQERTCRQGKDSVTC